ncbi:hypothetical protein L9F63_015907 [Diploptera punctata]|uniref:15-hydroxyprostaglandin dehydrogenase [NAD(+)]-like n=1 Tax=Diploptera punctata TaxID=6984 RepID=A0AAD8A4W4_DIPPU|nr:hypothetical protein L9F63_015907 [Diploptera punctata]
MEPIRGRVVLVTGGACGIGLEVAKQLLQQGAKGVSICDVNVTKGETEVKQLQQLFGAASAVFIRTDVTKQQDVQAAFERTVKQFGGVHIVINNAGILDDNKWQQCVSINVNGVVHTALLALEYMGRDRGGGGGVLVNTASTIGMVSADLKITVIYSATKSAVIALSRSLGNEFIEGTTGVRVLCVLPGFTDTELVSSENKVVTARPDWMSEFNRQMAVHPPPQKVENVGKAVVHMIREGKTGSLWVSESDQPAYEIKIPPHHKLKV